MLALVGFPYYNYEHASLDSTILPQTVIDNVTVTVTTIAVQLLFNGVVQTFFHVVAPPSKCAIVCGCATL